MFKKLLDLLDAYKKRNLLNQIITKLYFGFKKLYDMAKNWPNVKPDEEPDVTPKPIPDPFPDGVEKKRRRKKKL